MSPKPTYQQLQQRVKELEQEVEEHKQAREALKQSEARYRRLISDSPLGILTIDHQGRITEVNPKTLEILGSPSVEATQALNVFEFPLLVKSGISADIRRCLETGEPIVADHPYVSKWGKPVHLRYHLTPIMDPDSNITGVQAVHEDFTKLKQAEAAIQKHKEELEDLVRKRTAELTRANQQLTITIKKLQGRTNATLLLNELSELLQACDSEEETYTVVISICQRLFPTDSGYLGILNNSRKVLTTMASWGTSPVGEQEFELNQCWALRRGKVHAVVNPETTPICPHLRDWPNFGCLCAPMSAQGEVLGMLHLCIGPTDEDQSERGRVLVLESKQMLVISLVERYAPSLTSLRLRETLRNQSIRDPLTDLYNRRYMQEFLLREERRAKRHGTNLGIIIIDVDHFKAFNDTHGHEAGDILLRELGSFLKKDTREEDIACRYGGEEFTLILPEASLENTRRRAEELRLGVKEKLRVEYLGQTLRITISLGVAVYPQHGATAEDVLVAADTALYRAKAAGRDRVVLAPSSPVVSV
ncbi:MAG: diguanylate cyclase [Desulfobacterales bacterium]|nr:MAG: diguanylate cyclase [Desulfobacterales bacterium]